MALRAAGVGDEELLARADANYDEVVRPYLDSDDIAEEPTQAPRRWIIDFAQRSLEPAAAYRAALNIIRAKAKPFRETVNRKGHRERWWQSGEPRVGLRKAIAPLTRGAIGRHGKQFALALGRIHNHRQRRDLCNRLRR
jgi:hypothetical protein